MLGVPNDLVQWFETGCCVAERHGLARFAFPWRVIEVWADIGPDADHPHILKGGGREFKTYEAAKRYRDKLANEGKMALMQQGITVWLDQDEWPPPS